MIFLSPRRGPDLRHIHIAIPFSLHATEDPKDRQNLTAITDKSGPTLLTVPREIRDQILSYLLICPILATGDSLTVEFSRDDQSREAYPRYDLDPSILFCCKQLYQEGSAILYGRNEFIVDCTNSIFVARNDTEFSPALQFPRLQPGLGQFCGVNNTLVVNPLTRWYKLNELLSDTPLSVQRNLEVPFRHLCLAPIHRIRKWKVLVSRKSMYPYSGNALLEFCRAVCTIPGLRLSLLCVPMEKFYLRADGDFNCEIKHANRVHQIWDPLKLLRQVSNLEFREATEAEIPGYRYRNLRGLQGLDEKCHGLLASTKYLQEHAELMRGSSPWRISDTIHLQFDNLLAYAQAFEYHPEFKADMASPADPKSLLPRWKNPNNIFRGRNPHAIDLHLEDCREAVFKNDSKRFEISRNQLLLFLEKQYKKINEHATRLNDFIKSEKKYDGFFGLARWSLKVALSKPYRPSDDRPVTWQPFDNYNESKKNEWWDRSTEALMLLEAYADSYLRDLSFQERIDYRKHGIAELYQVLPRAKLMANINEANKYQAHNNFIQWFKEAVEDLDGQLLQIRQTRQRLFQYEVDGKKGKVIVVDDGDFEAIVWGVNEPAMYPRVWRPTE